MPGAGRSESTAMQYIGAAVFLVAVVGWLLFGWDFQSSDGSIPLVIAAVCVLLAVSVTAYNRLT